MQILIAVIDDLYAFILRIALTPLVFFKRYASEGDPEVQVEESLRIKTEEVEARAPQSSSFRKVEDIIGTEETKAAVLSGGGKNTVMYAGSTEVPVYLNPTMEFDSVTGTLTFGDMVMVLEQKGRWAKVVHGEEEGWVLREDLVDRAAHVYPKFIIGEPNNADDPNTIRVRAIIDDMFSGAKAELPLQAGEYVMYRLIRKGLTLSWAEIRPRTPGRWQTILKGASGVHISITPKTGAIMEYMMNENIGHLAYVEAVFPDETINISEVNFPEDGIYNERVLTREEWQELKPVFMQVV